MAIKSILNDLLMINADAFTPIDSTFMTTGEIWPVERTPMDFRKPTVIGERINNDYEQLKNADGYDHNWVLNTKGDVTQVAASVYCPVTGIQLEVYTTEPGIQVYTGNFLDGTITGKTVQFMPNVTPFVLKRRNIPILPTNQTGHHLI